MTQQANPPDYPQGDPTSDATPWPTDVDGRPKRFHELGETERRAWLARGLRAVIREYEIADAAHRARLERW